MKDVSIMEELSYQPTGDISELRKIMPLKFNHQNEKFLQMEDLLCLCEWHCFKQWSHKKDLVWVSYMWHIMIENGLANSNTKIAKLEGIKNFICLSIIYDDFCYIYEGSASSMTGDDWNTVVWHLFPDLRDLIDQVDRDDFHASIRSDDRHKRIANAIFAQYDKSYENSSHSAILEDLIGTVEEVFQEEPIGNYIPFGLLNYRSSRGEGYDAEEGISYRKLDAITFIMQDFRY